MRAAYGGSKKKQLLFRKSELIINECAIELPEWLARSRGAGSICKIAFAIRATNWSFYKLIQGLRGQCRSERRNVLFVNGYAGPSFA